MRIRVGKKKPLAPTHYGDRQEPSAAALRFGLAAPAVSIAVFGV
jgi:hypothetical protein